MTQTIKQRVTLAHVARELRAIKEILDAPSATFDVQLPRGFTFTPYGLPADSPSPVSTPPATTSVAALVRVRRLLLSARHSVTPAVSFFRRPLSSFFTLRNKGDAR